MPIPCRVANIDCAFDPTHAAALAHRREGDEGGLLFYTMGQLQRRGANPAGGASNAMPAPLTGT